MFAARLARRINMAKRGKHALILGLVGELGAGKTTFVQGFIKTFGVKHRIVSPSFLIFRVYPIPRSARTAYKRIYHVDCYRVHNTKELDAIGFKEIIKNSENIVLVEWADKIKEVLSKGVIWLKFHHGHKLNERVIGSR